MTRRRRAGGIAVLAAILLAGACSTSGNWHFVRERPAEKSTTTVTVRSDPPGAEVMLNGTFMGTTPFEVPIRYPYAVRLFERRDALPYPHIEEREVHVYTQNQFEFRFRLTGYEPVVKTLTPRGEPKAEVKAVLKAK